MNPFSPWQQRAWERAMDAHASGRLPHALLICGPALLGKRVLARALAQRLLCAQAHAAQAACGHCRACSLLNAGTHPDFYEVSFELNDKGEPRSEITIDQMRVLGDRLVLTPQMGGAQVALLHPAEALNRSAFNALLKTLEEPPPGRFLILVSDQANRLPVTIRSRCQRLELRAPPLAEARAWLLAQGVAAPAADEALAANLGHPGMALRDIREDGLTLRRSVAGDLAALSAGRERPAAVALRWIEDRAAQRLHIAAEGVRTHLAQRARGERGELPVGLDARALLAWFDEAARVQALLRTPLRQDLMLSELLRQWREASAGAVVHPASR